MLTYSIAYEIRHCMSGGKFTWVRDYVTTDKGYEQAAKIVFDSLHTNGYETRGGGIGTMRIESIL